MFVLTKRIFHSGWQGMTRDGGMAIANIFIMVMAISVITSLFLFRDISQFVIRGLQEKVDVSVYFKYEVAEEDVLRVKEAVSGIPEVKEVNYVSKQEAFERFTEKHGSNPVLMESLTEVGTNPFLASLGIKAFQAYQYEAVVGFLESPQYDYLIEKIDYHERKPVIESIYSLTSNFNKAGIAFSVVFILIAVLVAFNAVRLSIYNSREEIKIQKLVGASNWFVRGPFLAQGMICGFFAAVFCFLLFTLLTWGLDSKAELLFPGLGLFSFFVSNIWMILLIQLASGIVLGILSSLIAVRRYLKV
jgi:cell division transport system permease protein